MLRHQIYRLEIKYTETKPEHCRHLVPEEGHQDCTVGDEAKDDAAAVEPYQGVLGGHRQSGKENSV